MSALHEQRYVISNSADFGRVAVLLGGHSSEREVSLDTGTAVLEALQSRGIDAHRWDPAEKSMAEFAGAGFDRVWIALHGPGGEDGAVQGLLQWLGVPYTGSGVMASALAMDKVRSKHLFRAVGIPTPDYAVVSSREEASVAAENLGFPLIVKPSGQGSSVGMTKVFERAELNDAIELALQYDDTVLLETCINGDEFTVGVLQGRALPSIRIVTPRVFYDYRAKYESDRTEYICPGTQSDEEEAVYAEIAVEVFRELGC
jgi:D-alanine-D-alanine ligase